MSMRAALVALALTAPALADTPHPFDDAIAVWHMDSAKDSAGADSELAAIGRVEFGVELQGAERESSIASGGDGLAVRLTDGALSAAQGAGAELNPHGYALTMLVRLKNTSGDWDTTLFTKHGGHDRMQYNIFCFGMPDGGLDIGAEVGTTRGFAKAPGVIPADELDGWHDVIARYDGTRIELYFDGRLRGSTPCQGALRPGTDVPAIIGGEPLDGKIARRFTGLIDHVVLWDRALTDDEIAMLSHASLDKRLYAEPYRPQVHFTPERNWMNDPNGLVYAFGEWHLFFQHNPFGNTWGHMSWGHAVSPDLMHWEHLPVAIPERGDLMAFSGSAVYDKHNTSGLGTGAESPLVAIYTGHDSRRNRQSQRVAYSNDRGRTWTDDERNPVIPLELEHFRDPKVFWHDETSRWIMVVSLADQTRASFYASPDLIHWDNLSDWGPAGATGVPNWECPDLFELPVEGTGESKWVLCINVGGNAAAGGSGGQYFVGEFDGTAFHNDNPDDLVLWIDHGADFYAAQTYDNAPDGRRVCIAWMNDWRYANQIPTHPWRSAMSIPRELSLIKTPDGVRLRQLPVRELETLRLSANEFGPQTITSKGFDLSGEVPSWDALEIELEFELRDATRFGVRLFEDDRHATVVGYDLRLREMFVDRRRSGESGFSPDFAAFHSAPLHPDQLDRVRLRLIVDQSSIEAFGQDGEAAITDRVFPPPSARGISLFAERGEIELIQARIYPLKRVWAGQR